MASKILGQTITDVATTDSQRSIYVSTPGAQQRAVNLRLCRNISTPHDTESQMELVESGHAIDVAENFGHAGVYIWLVRVTQTRMKPEVYMKL